MLHRIFNLNEISWFNKFLFKIIYIYIYMYIKAGMKAKTSIASLIPSMLNG